MNPIVRALYGWLLAAASPLLRRKLARRAQAEPGYAHDLAARFGHYGDLSAEVLVARGQWLWVHAVSLGEARVAALLLPELRRALPGARVLLTHSTATGWAMGRDLLQPGDHQTWLPWDAPGPVARFLDTFAPRVGLLLETEVWPELTAACRDAGVPLWLVNARLSAKSLRQAQRVGVLARPTYAALSGVLAQYAADAERLRSLGAPVRAVLGNIKFDVKPDPALLAMGRGWRSSRAKQGLPPVVVFALSREGEEALLLEAIGAAAQAADGLGRDAVQWLIVPRHPQRFDEVAALIEARGWSCVRRSSWGPGGPAAVASAAPAPVPAIWLGDTLREMPLYYGLADAGLLGGSFLPLGGQNLIEAAACGCPLLLGPHTFNFADAAEGSIQAGAAQRVENIEQALLVLKSLLSTEKQTVELATSGLDEMRARAQQFVAAHAGAARATAEHIKALWG